MRRRREEAEESRVLWQEFEGTTPIADPEPPSEETEPARAQQPEELTAPER